MIKSRPLANLLISLLLAVAIFYLMGREILGASTELRQRFDSSAWLHASIYWIFMLSVQFLFVFGWWWVLRLHSIASSIKKTIYSFSVPNLGKYLPGKVFFVAGRVELVKISGASRRVGLSCFILENLYITAGAVLMSVPAICNFLGCEEPKFVLTIFFFCFGVLYLAFGTGLAFRLLNWGLLKFGQAHVAQSLHQKSGLPLFVNYTLLWIIYGFAGWLLTSHLFDIASTQLIFVGSVFVAAWLGGFLTFVTPGGLGVREGLLVVLLASVITPAEASAVAILSRLIWTVAELGLSLVSVIFLGTRFKSEPTP